MLNEMENAQKRAAELQRRNMEIAAQQEAIPAKEQTTSAGWLRHFKGVLNNQPLTYILNSG